MHGFELTLQRADETIDWSTIIKSQTSCTWCIEFWIKLLHSEASILKVQQMHADESSNAAACIQELCQMHAYRQSS